LGSGKNWKDKKARQAYHAQNYNGGLKWLIHLCLLFWQLMEGRTKVRPSAAELGDQINPGFQ
jgi:hypothetical protein